MSADVSSRTAELAARQVETIVNAAHRAADEIRQEAARERAEVLQAAERDATRIREEVKREAGAEVERAQRAAGKISDDAFAKAKEMTDDAGATAQRVVAGAQRAADEALADAHAMSHGLRRLGAVLGDQAERILRDVQAAHKRLSADLRVASGVSTRPEDAAPARREAAPARRAAGSTPTEAEAEALTRLAERERVGGTQDADREEIEEIKRRAARRTGGSAVEELDVPRWVEPGP
jgi:cell division septum initiation protein DivIVA